MKHKQRLICFNQILVIWLALKKFVWPPFHWILYWNYEFQSYTGFDYYLHTLYYFFLHLPLVSFCFFSVLCFWKCIENCCQKQYNQTVLDTHQGLIQTEMKGGIPILGTCNLGTQTQLYASFLRKFRNFYNQFSFFKLNVKEKAWI